MEPGGAQTEITWSSNGAQWSSNGAGGFSEGSERVVIDIRCIIIIYSYIYIYMCARLYRLWVILFLFHILADLFL